MPTRDIPPLDPFMAWQTWGVDYIRRRVVLHGEVGLPEEGSKIGVDHVIRNLLWLDETEGPIELWLNTPGGDMSEMWALHDVMTTCANDVLTVAVGCVASAGCLVLAAGTGQRYAMPNASLMWHQGTSSVAEDLNFRDAAERLEFDQRERVRWLAAMTRYTKRRFKYWEAKAMGELWLDAEEMVEHGIVDKLWERS